MEIRSANELNALVTEVIDEQRNTYVGSIEEYLRSVWSSILVHKNETPTYHLLAEIIREAFHTKPAPFENEWMKQQGASSGATLLDDSRETIKPRSRFCLPKE